MAKKTKEVAAKRKPGTPVFGEIQKGIPIPAKQTKKGEFYKHLAGMEVGDMLHVDGVTLSNARTNIKRVIADNDGRKYDPRHTDVENIEAGVDIWRVA